MARKVMTSFTLSPQKLAEAQDRCSQTGLSMAQVLRFALNEALRMDNHELHKRVVEFKRNEREREE